MPILVPQKNCLQRILCDRITLRFTTLFGISLMACGGLIGAVMLLWEPQGMNGEAGFKQRVADAGAADSSVPGSCTVFMNAIGDRMLFGNNEDYTNYNTFYWSERATSNRYGGVYFGYDDFFPQGGINDKGLIFDYTSLPGSVIVPHPERPHREPEIYDSGIWSEPSKVMTMMRHAATVKEAVDIAKTYDWAGTLYWQVMLVDATGDAVIISAGPDGDLAFTRKLQGEGYLVAANFNPANPTNNYAPFPCPRYTKATKRMANIQSASDLTVETFRKTLDEVHSEGPNVNTIYSNIIDPQAGKIYLYYWHQFNEVVEFDIAEEIAKGVPPTSIRSLFPDKTVRIAEIWHFYHRNRRLIKATGLAVVLATLGTGAIFLKRRIRVWSPTPTPTATA